MKSIFIHIIKGAIMGAANVIPGVSGGTMALVMGIYERLINSINHLNFDTLKKIFITRDFKSFAKDTDLFFLISITVGIFVSIFSLSILLEFLFESHKILVLSYFFGLIFASVFFVGKTIKKYTPLSIFLFLIGFLIAGGMVFISPSSSNSSFLFLIISGAIAMCSMILPGLSGSFVLLLIGNYELIICAINDLNFTILIPFGIGAVSGIILFAKFLQFIFKKFRNNTISLLTGFIFGSLIVLWPWKLDDINSNSFNYFIPNLNLETFIAFALILLGALSVVMIEKYSKN
jgi:putative membrane protein